MDPMDPHDDWTSPAATTMRSFFRILLLSVRSPSQSTHPGTDLLAYSSCFCHFLRTRGNLKINWHIFHCKLTRCCSLFINSLEVQLQTTVARILCKLYIINVVLYAACRNFRQECQKNQKRKKNAGKKTRSFCLAAGFWHIQTHLSSSYFGHEDEYGSKCHQKPTEGCDLGCAQCQKNGTNSILPYIHIYHIHIYILCFLLRFFLVIDLGLYVWSLLHQGTDFASKISSHVAMAKLMTSGVTLSQMPHSMITL